MQQCSPAGETALQHEHMCGALSDAVGSLARAVAVLLAAGMLGGALWRIRLRDASPSQLSVGMAGDHRLKSSMGALSRNAMIVCAALWVCVGDEPEALQITGMHADGGGAGRRATSLVR